MIFFNKIHIHENCTHYLGSVNIKSKQKIKERVKKKTGSSLP